MIRNADKSYWSGIWARASWDDGKSKNESGDAIAARNRYSAPSVHAVCVSADGSSLTPLPLPGLKAPQQPRRARASPPARHKQALIV